MIGKILSIEFVYICGTVCAPILHLNSRVLFGIVYLVCTSILKIFVSNACALTLSKFLIFANNDYFLGGILDLDKKKLNISLINFI